MPEKPKDPVDPKSFLLPKKESGPSPMSAQRINAGALLAQEVNAAAVPPPQTVPTVGVPFKPPVKEESQVKAVQTYTTDINRVIKTGEVSAVTIAAAEADRRVKEATKDEPLAPSLLSPEEKTSRWRAALLVGGAALIMAALGVAATLVLRAMPQTPVPAGAETPFMSVDQTEPVPVAPAATRDTLMTQLEAARERVSLSVGLVAQLYVGTATSSSPMPERLSAPQLLATLAPDIPQDLLRTLLPTYLLGVHSYDENQAFLVLRVDSYQLAYAGLLAWESTMPGELAPLFTRHPSPRLPNQADASGGSAASTSAEAASEFVKTGFVDKVVENHDTRAKVNGAGDLLLLWTFLDRNTVVITTNEYTLREVIRRINTASLVPQP